MRIVHNGIKSMTDFSQSTPPHMETINKDAAVFYTSELVSRTRSCRDWYRLVMVCTHDNFIVLPHWDCQHHDLISHSVTLFWPWGNYSFPYPINAEHLPMKQQVSVFKSLVWLNDVFKSQNGDRRSIHSAILPSLRKWWPEVLCMYIGVGGWWWGLLTIFHTAVGVYHANTQSESWGQLMGGSHLTTKEMWV